MVIIHVHIHVKPESVEAFKQATLENARNSVKRARGVRGSRLYNRPMTRRGSFCWRRIARPKRTRHIGRHRTILSGATR